MTATDTLRDHWVQRRQYLSMDRLIIEHFDAVTMIRSTLHTGQNQFSGKDYFRWSRVFTTYSIRPTSTGKRTLRIYSKSVGAVRTKSTIRDVSLIFSGGKCEPEVAAAVERMMMRVTGTELQLRDEFGALRRHMFPILGDMLAQDSNLWSRVEYAAGIGFAFRESTVQGMTLALFGKRRYRKDLVRAVASADLWALRVAHDVKTLVEVDWIVEFLRDHTGRSGQRPVPFAANQVKLLFAAIPKHRRRALLFALGNMEANYSRTNFTVADSISMAGTVAKGGHFTLDIIADCKNWSEIHETLRPAADATVQLSRTKKSNSTIKLRTVSEALNGTEASGVKLDAATNLDELMLWGRELRNCIGSYFNTAQKGHTNLFVLVQDGKRIGNMEVTPMGEIRQLVGFANQNLPKGLDSAVREHVASTLKPVLKSNVTLAA